MLNKPIHITSINFTSATNENFTDEYAGLNIYSFVLTIHADVQHLIARDMNACGCCS
jgi:hypothetical protein